MVDRSSLRAVIGLLGELGYDTRLDGNSGEELETRLSRMLGNRRGKLRGACSLKRGSQKIDLHSSLRIRFDSSVDFRTLMDGSRDIEVEGMTLRGPSLDAIMMIQLIVITDDLGRSACRAKLFLDLYLLCRDLGPGWSWEAFLEARCKQGLEKLAVNICALFLDLWDVSGEFPELAAAIDRRVDQLEIAGPTDADAILARPRHDRANKRFSRRIYPGGTPGAVALAISADLPHVTARAMGLRRSQYCFSSR